jgi:hypothetical protein
MSAETILKHLDSGGMEMKAEEHSVIDDFFKIIVISLVISALFLFLVIIFRWGP